MTLKPIAAATAVAVTLIVTAAFTGPATADAPETGRCFELRIYTTHPGKLPDLNKRFRDHTCRIFRKHGMEVIGFWTVAPQQAGSASASQANDSKADASEEKLYYILAYPNREAREKAWKAFVDDPQWKQVYAQSRAQGPIVKKVENAFLEATDYSPLR